MMFLMEFVMKSRMQYLNMFCQQLHTKKHMSLFCKALFCHRMPPA